MAHPALGDAEEKGWRLGPSPSVGPISIFRPAPTESGNPKLAEDYGFEPVEALSVVAGGAVFLCCFFLEVPDVPGTGCLTASGSVWPGPGNDVCFDCGS